MLQQTQVATVLGYFDRFMARFPSLNDLAQAPIDDVLALWSGLGYYARARNLHKTACVCLQRHDGKLPKDPATLEQLPGIGRSTANAIVAQAHNQRAVILDGNVKRVLTRHFGIDGWPGQTEVEKKLWDLAASLTPHQRARDYTQAIMDLGATVCTRRRPACDQCPVASDCRAAVEGKTHIWPHPRPKKKKRILEMTLTICLNSKNQVLVEKRAAQGIWGGLWCLPETQSLPEIADVGPGPSIEPTRHELTHRTVWIKFHSLRTNTACCMDQANHRRWLALSEINTLGFPRPIQRVLETLSGMDH